MINNPQDDNDKTNIHILDKNFRVKCPPDQIESLNAAADYLDKEMRKMRQNGVVGMDRIAIITALNITHELLQVRQQNDQLIDTTTKKVQELLERIDEALTTSEQLELNDITSE